MALNKNEKEDIIQSIKKIVAEIAEIDIKEIKENSSLYDDLCIDSLDIEEIIIEIEDKCNLTLKNEEIEEFDTINDIAESILKT